MLSQNIAQMGQKYGEMESRITEKLNSLEQQNEALSRRIDRQSEEASVVQRAAGMVQVPSVE